MRSCPRKSAKDSNFAYLFLLNLAADCFPARDCGPSVSMVITGRPRHYYVSSSQSIYYKLVHREIKACKHTYTKKRKVRLG